jgi:hypothetical protein
LAISKIAGPGGFMESADPPENTEGSEALHRQGHLRLLKQRSRFRSGRGAAEASQNLAALA